MISTWYDVSYVIMCARRWVEIHKMCLWAVHVFELSDTNLRDFKGDKELVIEVRGAATPLK